MPLMCRVVLGVSLRADTPRSTILNDEGLEHLWGLSRLSGYVLIPAKKKHLSR